MILVVRVLRVLLTLVLATFVITLIIGVATPEIGLVEKVVFVTLIAGCLVLAAHFSTWSTRAQARFRHM